MKARGGLGVTEEVGEGDDVLDETGMEVGAEAEGRGEDDVDGHHAVSVGKMDQEKLFYVMSRGLDLNEARRLVVEASFQPVLERIADGDLRAEVEQQIEELIADGK